MLYVEKCVLRNRTQIGCEFLTERWFPWNVEPSGGWLEFPRTLLLFARRCYKLQSARHMFRGGCRNHRFICDEKNVNSCYNKYSCCCCCFCTFSITVLVAFFRYVGSILALWGRTPHRALLIFPQTAQNEDLVFRWCLTGQNGAKCVHEQYTTYWVESKRSTDSSSCRRPSTTAQVPSVNMLLKLWSWESTAQSLVCKA